MDQNKQQSAVDESAFSEVTEQDYSAKKHSGIGITSTIIGAIALIIFVISLVMIIKDAPGFFATIDNGLNADMLTEEEATAIVNKFPGLISGFLLLLGAGFFLFIGGILGIIGLFSQTRRKLFPIIGVILNGLPIILLIVVATISTMIG